jgi:hypothetical protein
MTSSRRHGLKRPHLLGLSLSTTALVACKRLATDAAATTSSIDTKFAQALVS